MRLLVRDSKEPQKELGSPTELKTSTGLPFQNIKLWRTLHNNLLISNMLCVTSLIKKIKSDLKSSYAANSSSSQPSVLTETRNTNFSSGKKKNPADTTKGHMVLGNSAWAQGWTKGLQEIPFQSQPLCDKKLFSYHPIKESRKKRWA